MGRTTLLRRGIAPTDAILEIGPYHAPLAPKRLGYNTTILDIETTQALRDRAARDPQIGSAAAAAIEEVDVVGSACDLADLTRSARGADACFAWILSSHNIEHLPNPIRFLRQCADVLRPGGVLRMAAPDKRACFDHFRPLTEVSEWLQAYHEKRVQPTVYQLFREETGQSTVSRRGKARVAWRLGDIDAAEIVPVRTSLDRYRSWFGPTGRPPEAYIDTHCWAFIPESFEILIRDVIAFGLVPLEVVRVSATRRHEFFVDLRKPVVPLPVDEEAYFAKRAILLRRCMATDRAAVASWKSLPWRLARRTLGLADVLMAPRRAG